MSFSLLAPGVRLMHNLRLPAKLTVLSCVGNGTGLCLSGAAMFEGACPLFLTGFMLGGAT